MGASPSNPLKDVPNPAGAGLGSANVPTEPIGPGSQQNTQGWQFGDPVCPVDRVFYTKRVADRILFDLNQIDKNDNVWKDEEKKKVAEAVAGIACNLHENWCLYGKVFENAIGGPLGRTFGNNS